MKDNVKLLIFDMVEKQNSISSLKVLGYEYSQIFFLIREFNAVGYITNDETGSLILTAKGREESIRLKKFLTGVSRIEPLDLYKIEKISIKDMFLPQDY